MDPPDPEQEDDLNQMQFSDLCYSTSEAVVVNMTVESTRRRSDWRALAGILGFTEKQVQLIKQDSREPCKGRQLVRVWEDLGKSSLRKFILALKEANMGECLKAIMRDPYLQGRLHWLASGLAGTLKLACVVAKLYYTTVCR